MIKYKCDNCGNEIEIDETIITDWGGEKITFLEYIKRSSNNDSVWICCDPCIHKMPDASLFFERGEVFARIPKNNNLN
jgi:hypothetical protein